MQKESKHTSLTNKERFVRNVSRDILSGTYEVGQKLPAERELAAQMSMSKTIVHSGLEQLSKMGLVDVKPQSGTYVADYIQTGNIDTLNAIVQFEGGQFSNELTIAILDLRMAIEGTAFKLLGERHTPQDIERLRSLTEEIRCYTKESPKDFDGLSELFFKWHREICILCRSNILPLLMNTVEKIALPFWVVYIQQVGIEQATNLLDKFVDLIEAGNGEEASGLMEEGIKDYLEGIARS